MASRFSPGDLLTLGAVSITGAALMASLAWAQMHAFRVVYGAVCGSGVGLLHCPACYAAATLLALGLASLVLAQAARRRPIPVEA